MNPVTNLIKQINDKIKAEHVPSPGTYPEMIGIPEDAIAGLCGMSRTRWSFFEQGGYDAAPTTVCKFADQQLGEGAGERFEAEYAAFRASLPEDTKAEIERRLYPAGRACGMVA